MGTKICSNCRLEKNLDSYNKNKSRPDGLGTYCKECRAIKRKIGFLQKSGKEIPQELVDRVTTNISASEKRKETIKIKYGVDHFSHSDLFSKKIQETTERKRASTDFGNDTGEVKRCSSCDQIKPVTMFSKSSYTTDGYRCYCKDCKNLKDRNKRKQYSTNSVIDERKTSNVRLLTNKIKYGTEHPIQRQEIKEKILNTTIEKYGVDTYSKSEEFKDKIINTSLEKYGVTNYFKLPNFIDIRSESCLKKYGKKYPAMKDDYKLDSGHYLIDLLKEKNIPQVKHSLCRNLYRRFGLETVMDYIELGKLPRNTSLERETSILLGLNYFGKRPINNFERYPDFKLTDTLYLDVDGLYWHSIEVRKDKNYHYKKREQYEERGLRLLQIREDEINTKPHIVKNLINIHLNTEINRVFARDCNIINLEWNQAQEFLNKYHIQGVGLKSRSIGLQYKGEICQLMTYRRSSKNNNIIEISRFVTKAGHRVVGGFSRLLSRIIHNTSPIEVHSFCDLRYSDGQVYEKNGFIEHHTSLGWCWTDFVSTFNRLQCRAGEGRTEDENAEKLGWVRIYDAGQRLYVLKI